MIELTLMIISGIVIWYTTTIPGVQVLSSACGAVFGISLGALLLRKVINK